MARDVAIEISVWVKRGCMIVRRDCLDGDDPLRAELKAVRLDEREACAKIADEIRRGAEARHKLANYFSDAAIDACAQMGAAGAIANAIRRRTIEGKND